MPLRSPVTPLPDPPESVSDELQSLGAGSCIDVRGRRVDPLQWVHAYVKYDGSSPYCEKECLDNIDCVGYATRARKSKCGLLLSKDIASVGPSSVDSHGVGHCFARHPYAYNSAGAYSEDRMPVPHTIWSFWQNKEHAQDIPGLVRFSSASWKKLNPSWDVHLLNQKSVYEWLDRNDLPEHFDTDKYTLQQKSDAVRLALLEKYGGVWVDPTNVLLKPMDEVIGTDPNVSTFMYLDRRTHNPEGRVDATHFIDSGLLSASPQDPLLVRTKQCFYDLLPKLPDGTAELSSTGMFSKRQLEILKNLGISDVHLATHACFLKSADEDTALWHSFAGSKVQHLDASTHAYKAQGIAHGDRNEFQKRLIDTTDDEMLRAMSAKDVSMLKIRDSDLQLRDEMTEEDLGCKKSTFQQLLHSIGLPDESSTVTVSCRAASKFPDDRLQVVASGMREHLEGSGFMAAHLQLACRLSKQERRRYRQQLHWNFV